LINIINDSNAGITPERQIRNMLMICNMLFRIYVFDKFCKITSYERFRNVSEICFEQLGKCFTAKFHHNNHATELLNLILINFVNDNLMDQCLKQFFKSESVSRTGKLSHIYI